MAIHRILFRLDFNLNFRIVDSPGKVMELVASLGDTYWDGIIDAQKERAIGGRFASGEPTSLHRMATIQPKSFVFGIESVNPITNAKGGTPDFVSLCGLVDRFAEEFKVQELGRAGIRCWHLASILGNGPTTQKFAEALNPKFLAAVQTGGKIRDLGFSFDGAADERFKYHVRCGPVTATEIKAKDYFTKISESVAEAVPANVIFDVDHYEDSFSLKGRHPSSWAKSQLDRSAALISEIERSIKEDKL